MEESADPGTMKLIAEIQRQDTHQLGKGKQKVGDAPSDFELAAQFYEEDLKALEVFASDRIMCQSMMRAIIQDGPAILDHEKIERQARDDRHQAIGQPKTVANPMINAEPGPEINDEILQRLQNLYVFDGRYDKQGESSKDAANQEGENAPKEECTVCGERVLQYDIVECPCSHKYCTSCVIQLVEAAMNDESLFPPRCCTKPLPLLLLRCVISPELLRKYQQKEVEYATTDRTYCSVAACSEFIPSNLVQGDTAVCLKCSSTTCIYCKKPSHGGGDCPEDQSTEDLLTLAKENGWQRCKACRRMVELHTGCNHITCLCGAQFCYVCGLKWKQCRCVQWEEANLLERANRVVDRHVRSHAVNERERAALVASAREDLRRNHQCTHVGHWKFSHGAGTCEECHQFMPVFTFECTRCLLNACRRCHLNRL